MRLTAQLISGAPTLVNPEGQLTIQLRNLKIPYLENLGITNDKFEVIDLTNNEIVDLNNVPGSFKRLRCLLLASNNITIIHPCEHGDLYNLASISLANNNVQSFHDIQQLASYASLTNLSLLNNPIASHKHYRSFVIWLIPSLKVLDFHKVKQRERQQATSLFGESKANPTALAQSLIQENASESGATITSKEQRQLDTTVKKLTDEERVTLLHDLENADSIDEIERIEAALKNGYIQ